MASKKRLLNRILRRGDDACMLVSAAALMLVEVGYVAWLERLPALPSRAHSAGFLDLPPWYERPRVEVTLMLTVLGGMIAWAVGGVLGIVHRRPEETGASNRKLVNKRLKTAAFYAIVAGADLLVMQFLRT